MTTSTEKEPLGATPAQKRGQPIAGSEKLIACLHAANSDGTLARLPEALLWRPEECQPGGKGAEELSRFLLALSHILDAREQETFGHSHRVSLYALTLARVLGLSPQQLIDIEHAGLMHDVGKVGVADSILLKPGPLTSAEQALMRQHPALGCKLMKELECIGEAAEITLHHHERYDGRGYPLGLEGAAIPIGARVVAVADTLDAITTARPYRSARGFEAARAEILACGRTQFDPEVIQAFASIPLATWHEMAAQVTAASLDHAGEAPSSYA